MDKEASPLGGLLADVTGLDMDTLGDLPDTVFGHLLQNVVDEAVNPVGVPYAAFESSLA